MGRKKGGIGVLLTILLGSMLAVTMVFVVAGSRVAEIGYCTNIISLSGRSILSEFDTRLKDDYGLFAFLGDYEATEEKLKFYQDMSFKKKVPDEKGNPKQNLDMFQIERDGMAISLNEYALTNPEVLTKQICDYMKFSKTVGLVGKINISGDNKDRQVLETGLDEDGINTKENRHIKNQVILSELPSNGLGSESIDIDGILSIGINGIQGLISEGTEDYFVNEYVMSMFKYGIGDEKAEKTFFACEVEYILKGDFSDQKNQNSVRGDILKLRTGLNLMHIYANPEKRAMVVELALIVAPGPGASVAQAVIAGIWALAEGENDVRLIENGRPVPLNKTKESWALELGDTVEVVKDEEGNSSAKKKNGRACIDTGYEKGYFYKEYIKIFLYLQSKDVTLCRIMDLIQINMNYRYNKNFLLKNHYEGITISEEIKGKRYVIEEKY